MDLKLLLSAVTLGLCCACAASGAREAPAAGSERPAPALAERHARIHAARLAHNEREQLIFASLRADPDEQVQRALLESRAGSQRQLIDALWPIVEEDLADDASASALQSIATMHHSEADRDRAIALLARHHVKTARMADFAFLFEDFVDEIDGVRALLERVAAENPAVDARGQAAFALALADAARAHDEASIAACVERLRSVAAAYPQAESGNSTVAQRAEEEIGKLEAHGIGRLAPQIEGVGVDGEPLRLSAYRGKVVMLSFWGHW